MPAANRANRATGRKSARPALFGIFAALALGLALVGCAGAAKTPQILYMTPTPSPTPNILRPMSVCASAATFASRTFVNFAVEQAARSSSELAESMAVVPTTINDILQ